MSSNGQHKPACGFAVQGKPSALLLAALRTVARSTALPLELPACNGSTCDWVRGIADCLLGGRCRTAVLFCDDPELASCVGNKVKGIRAATVRTLAEARRAVDQVGANLLIVETKGRTFFEFKEFLRLASADVVVCPPTLACVLGELDGHAHR